MKAVRSAVAVAAVSLLMSGCASNLMRPAASENISAPGADKAKVVFMRTSFVAGAIGCDMFEVVNGELRFIGQLPYGNKITYETTPGDKVFMAYGTAADFMLAKLQGGKTYYSIVRPNWGTGGFAPTPIRNSSRDQPDFDSKEFKDWFSGTKLLEPNDNAPAWFKENQARMQQIYTEYWRRFQTKTDEEKAYRTLRPEDGR
ncbi:MAG: hypothetical protein OEO84_10965 [Betaproteobacteria bacterium]|nr:hypothetical protein [Betaproteobacteria bacterium]